MYAAYSSVGVLAWCNETLSLDPWHIGRWQVAIRHDGANAPTFITIGILVIIRTNQRWKADSIPGHVYKIFKHGDEPSLVELVEAIEEILKNFDFTYIAIDTLDKRNSRDDLFRVLKALATDSSFKKTSTSCIKPRVHRYRKGHNRILVSVSMASFNGEEDVRIFVRSTL